MSSLVHISISYLSAYTFVELLSSSIPFSSRFVVISFFASLFNIFLIFLLLLFFFHHLLPWVGSCSLIFVLRKIISLISISYEFDLKTLGFYELFISLR